MVASTLLGTEITEAVFADPDTAPISRKLKAALGLVRKLTLAPEEVGADDIRATLDAGVSEDGAIDAMYVCFAFNLIDRVSDALGFDLMDEEGYRRGHGTSSGSGTSSRHPSGCWPVTRPGRPRTLEPDPSPKVAAGLGWNAVCHRSASATSGVAARLPPCESFVAGGRLFVCDVVVQVAGAFEHGCCPLCQSRLTLCDGCA